MHSQKYILPYINKNQIFIAFCFRFPKFELCRRLFMFFQVFFWWVGKFGLLHGIRLLINWSCLWIFNLAIQWERFGLSLLSVWAGAPAKLLVERYEMLLLFTSKSYGSSFFFFEQKLIKFLLLYFFWYKYCLTSANSNVLGS